MLSLSYISVLVTCYCITNYPRTQWLKTFVSAGWKWKLLLCPTLQILQARILVWVAFLFSRASSQPRDRTQVYLHCRWILYQLSHQASPRILQWVTYPFSRGSSGSSNQTGISSSAGGFFTNWAIREVLLQVKNWQGLARWLCIVSRWVATKVLDCFQAQWLSVGLSFYRWATLLAACFPRARVPRQSERGCTDRSHGPCVTKKWHPVTFEQSQSPAHVKGEGIVCLSTR